MENKKVCKACGIEKDICEFSINLSKKDGYDIYCRKCTQLKAKNYRDKGKVVVESKSCKNCKVEQVSKNFYKQKSSKDGLSHICIGCSVKVRKENYLNRKEKDSEYAKQKRLKQKQENPEALKEQDKLNSLKRREYEREKFKNNPILRFSRNIRTRIYLSLKSEKKLKTTIEILCCTIEECKNHIESQFENWMNWDNYGNACETLEYNCSWDLDHIIPVSWATTNEELYMLNHWSNFQPLCSKINRDDKKSNIYPCTNIQLMITFGKKE